MFRYLFIYLFLLIRTDCGLPRCLHTGPETVRPFVLLFTLKNLPKMFKMLFQSSILTYFLEFLLRYFNPTLLYIYLVPLAWHCYTHTHTHTYSKYLRKIHMFALLTQSSSKVQRRYFVTFSRNMPDTKLISGCYQRICSIRMMK